MPPSTKTRKPAKDLTAADLMAFPVWEFALDEEGVEGQDESWVRPVPSKSLPSRSYSQLVSTRFETASGRDFAGYLVVSPARSTPTVLRHSGGAMLDADTQLFLAKFDGPAREFVKRDSMTHLTKALKLEPAEIFPLAFELLVLIEKEKKLRSGILPGPKNV